jgi:hypothetical protein
MPSDHRRHDRLLIARFAADDSYPGQADEAKSLISACSECAALAEDIKLLSNAVGSLPAPRRPRNFQLTIEQAERLRGSRLDRFLRSLGSRGWVTLRPVAGVGLSIGLVMATVGAWPLGGLPAGQPAAEPFTARQTTEAPALGPAAEQPGYEAAPPAGDVLNDAYVDSLNAEGVETYEQDTARTQSSQGVAPSDGSLLFYAGLLIAVLATGTLTLAWFARHRYSDPLLR